MGAFVDLAKAVISFSFFPLLLFLTSSNTSQSYVPWRHGRSVKRRATAARCSPSCAPLNHLLKLPARVRFMRVVLVASDCAHRPLSKLGPSRASRSCPLHANHAHLGDSHYRILSPPPESSHSINLHAKSTQQTRRAAENECS